MTSSDFPSGTHGWKNRITGYGTADPATLLANPNNWRRHPQAQGDALEGALREVGWVGGALVNTRTGNMIDGHLRVERALAAGAKEVPVTYVDLSSAEELIVLATLDPLAGMAETDPAALEALLAQVTVEDAALRALLEQDEAEDGETDPDAIPEPKGPIRARIGEVWVLGEHRLMCGDATRPDHIGKLMGGASAQLVFTDPPYGVAYQAEGHEAIQNDDLQRDALVGFLATAFKRMAHVMAPGAPAYIWHSGSTRDEFTFAMKAAGLLELQTIIWVKPSLVLGRGDYQWQHEACYYASIDGAQPHFYANRAETTCWYVQPAQDREGTSIILGKGVVVTDGEGREMYLSTRPPKGKVRVVRLQEGHKAQLMRASDTTDTWEVSRDTAHPEHPTQKPVALAERAIRNSSKRGDVVLDAFLGSGTTLMAAERLGRRCYGMELAPRYVDVTIRRWEQFTGKTAVRESAAPTNGTTPGPSPSSRPTRASTGKTKAPVT